mmetsp:Transcript_8887/g.19960  ORF Transcript_8887/g.19960 Transcript_8887/m.19960 type:complete len:492 (-) Transcript_8887:360-1835(-)|eukprot:CAMPEP_0172324204 /NCGR_PEP_ID=MMETSP1058-20130122/50708_1 /TAXON_ID=83371 /ORGANISM="Detonula confervacea, Strain CCMP 353" /LENGTH=491 /DNA_ID=CAMNT_0013040407 /DNA_START=51 /DNA_END=1526 /DNA_ORIENTATION=-
MLPQYLHIALLLLGQECISLVEAFGTSTSSSSNASKEPLLKWLIVGGGPHGVHISACLLDELVPSISHSNIQIVDDEPQLLHKWKTRTAATGMSYLRSSSSYHLDVREDGLKRFASEKRTKSKNNKHDPLFAADYQRPKLDFFNHHCDHVIAKNRLDKVHLQGRVTDIIPKETHVEVEIQRPNGDIVTSYAENIVLALGSDVPAYPDWATEDMIHAGKVRHIFADDDSSGDDSFYPRRQSIAIVGGGISAAHLALKLDREQAATRNTSCNTEIDNVMQTKIHILCRHEMREKQFDTHQDWMMDSFASKRSEAGGGQGIPKCQRHFASLNSFVERRNVIKRERQAGTISPSVSRGEGGLRYAIEEERIHWHEGDIRSVTEVESSGQLSISTLADENIVVDQIILATGFGKRPPCADLINSIAVKNNLLMCPCGYPAPDESLRWHKRIYLAGALAELELGPSARNIAGARLTSERIVAAATMTNVASLNGATV